jgi:hypothetical protein
MALGIHQIELVEGKRSKSMVLTLTSDGFALRTFKPSTSHTWDEVKSIEIEGPETVQKRITATRLLTIGVFALNSKARKTVGEVFVFISLRNGETLILKFSKTFEPQVKAIFAPYMSKVGPGAITTPEAQNAEPAKDPVDQIRKLGELLNEGLITQDEFAKMKKEILGS